MDLIAPNLLLIPSLQQTESFRAFMYRAAQVNAFPRMYAGRAHALKHAQKFLNQLENRDATLSQKLRLRLAPLPNTNYKPLAFSLGEEEIPLSYIRIEVRSVCPICIAENSWSRGEWELKAYTTCHLHGVRLLDRCDQCQNKFTWSRTEISRCYCGHAFSSIPPRSSKSWERKWATQLHQAFRYSIHGDSKKSDSATSISKLLLMVDIVRSVIIPNKLLTECYSDIPSRLLAELLGDPSYRDCLWESIFLHAAETPMLLAKKLSLGQTNEDLAQNYQGLAEDLPIPLKLKPKLLPLDLNSYTTAPKSEVIIDMRSHVARLKYLYGGRTDEEFDPFSMS